MSSYYEKFLATGEVKCIDEEIPFEIPATWEWVRLSNVSVIQEGPGIRSFQYMPSGIQLLTVTNILEGKVDMKKQTKFISEQEYNDKYTHFTLKQGDIVCACSGGSWGKSALFNVKGTPVILNTSTLRLRYFSDLGCNLYLYHITKSSFFKNQLAEQLSGMQPNFGYTHYSKVLLPLPPLREQKRISELIEQILPYIFKYNSAQEILNNLNNDISIKLKKSILQEAIQGKLVPQIAEEGTAQELLEQIKFEKQKLVKESKLKKSALADSIIYKGDDNKYYEQIDKETKEITEDILFDLPNKWQWCRIGIILMHNNGKQLNKGNSKGKLMKYITTSNLYWDGFVLDNLKEMPFEKNEIDRCMAVKGDLLVCEGGDIGRSCIWNYDFPIMLQNHIHKLRPYIPLCTKFFYYIFNLYNLAGLIGGKGIGIQGFSSKALHNTLVPLPPLKEQYRIVTQIEKLFEQLR